MNANKKITSVRKAMKEYKRLIRVLGAHPKDINPAIYRTWRRQGKLRRRKIHCTLEFKGEIIVSPIGPNVMTGEWSYRERESEECFEARMKNYKPILTK